MGKRSSFAAPRGFDTPGEHYPALNRARAALAAVDDIAEEQAESEQQEQEPTA